MKAELDYDGARWSVIRRRPCRWRVGTNPKGGSWERLSPYTLVRYPSDSALWVWLRAQGIDRPDRGQSEGDRERRVLSVRVRHTTIDRIDALMRSWGCTRGEAIERAVAGAE